MSFSYSFLATRLPMAGLESGLLAAWPNLRLVERASGFSCAEEVWAWASPRSGYLDGAHPNDVKILYADGAWTVVLDVSLCMTSDEDEILHLSRIAGRVVTAVTQGTAGVADLAVYDAGTLTRRLYGEAGTVNLSGAPLSEEAGLDVSHFYLDEIDTIWQRFGLGSFLQEPVLAGAVAIQVEDTKNYLAETEEILKKRATSTASPRKPWWRLW